MRYYPMFATKRIEVKKYPPSGSNSDALKQNCIDFIQTRGDQDCFLYVGTHMLKVFST